MGAGNLLVNGDFPPRSDGGVPSHWEIWTPAWENACCDIRSTADGLVMSSPNEPHGVGGVDQTVSSIRGGQAYKVSVEFEASGVSSPVRSLLARVGWLAEGKALHPAGEFVDGLAMDGDAGRFEDVFVAPEEADGVRVSLEAKWLMGGSVTWKVARLVETEAPAPRPVTIATVYYRPRDSTPERNIELYCGHIDDAGQMGADIVCLPEGMTVIGTGLDYGQSAQPIPGPATERLGAAAKRNGLWVVACFNEVDGPRLYNTAVLLDRDGRIAGKYRKVHLPREEWRQGITPGDSYPVFDTDFGRIAMQICHDYFFPEAETAFALAGAEIIFAPTWGTTFKDREGRVQGENMFRVRARDNGVYMVTSVFDGNSLIVDPLGRVLASSDGEDGVFTAEVDLNSRDPLWWVGDWRALAPRHRMPETYGTLTEST